MGRSHEIKIRARDRVSRYRARHELKEHERDVWMVFAPPGYDGASSEEPLPLLLKIDPRPRVVDKPIDAVVDGASTTGVVAARLSRLEVSNISRTFRDDELRPLFYVVAPANSEVTPEMVRDRKVVRYRLIGDVDQFEAAWRLMLVEER